MLQMMKTSTESVLTLVADGSQIGGTKPTSTASVVERTRVFSTHSLQPGRIACMTAARLNHEQGEGCRRAFMYTRR